MHTRARTARAKLFQIITRASAAAVGYKIALFPLNRSQRSSTRCDADSISPITGRLISIVYLLVVLLVVDCPASAANLLPDPEFCRLS